MQSETEDFTVGATTWRTGQNFCVVFDSGPLAVLCQNMTSSTKPEVHNVLYCRQMSFEPQPPTTRTEYFVKFGHVVIEICERTHIQTNRQTNIHTC